ncbi:MAG: GspH/FimT family pseudopilin [bacterium]
MQNKIKNQTGFSMAELVIVLAITSIIATISIMIYKQLEPNLDLDANTRQVASDLRYAQQLTVTEQAIYSVQFDQSHYSIINTVSAKTILSRTLKQNITLPTITGFTDNTVRFTPTGAAIQSGIIYLKNSKNTTSSVEIKPSGYVEIHQK